MKVLMINSFYYVKGGAERCFFDLGTALVDRGIDVIPFSMEHPQNVPSKYSKYFVSRIDYPTALAQGGLQSKLDVIERTIYSREARDKIARLVVDEQPDLVHIHGFIHEMSVSILPVLRKAGLPVIQTLHDYKLRCPNTSFVVNNEICERCKGHRYYNVALQRCKRGSLMASVLAGTEMYVHELLGLYEPNIDLFISPSMFLHNKMLEHGVNKEIVEIPNFVDLDRLPPAYEPDNYCLYVGRLAPGKGLHVLLDAYQQVPSEFPLYIAGRGELEVELKELAKARGLDNIHFLGHLNTDELNRYLRSALFVILPSVLYENNPMSILEAFASGTAAVGSRLGGIVELIAANQAGLLYEPGNAQELAEKINYLFAHRDEAIEMGKRGRQQVEAMNSTEAHLQKTLEVYNRLVPVPATAWQRKIELSGSMPG